MLNRAALTMRLERFADCARDCEAVLRLLEGADGKKVGAAGAEAAAAAAGDAGKGAEDAGEGEGDEDDEEADGVSAVPVKGSPLFDQVAQRARARLAECRRHLGVPEDAASTPST